MTLCHTDKMTHFSVRTCLALISPHHMGLDVLHCWLFSPPAKKKKIQISSSAYQNGEVMPTVWKEDAEEPKSTSVLQLKITPADNQAVVSCESFNLVSPSPHSVSGRLTVLCE